jgi:hypothetical protein
MVIPTHRIQAMSGAFLAIIVFHQLIMCTSRHEQEGQ